MTKADLIDEVSRLAELTRKDSEVIVETIFDSIVRSLRVGDKIEILGFGSSGTGKRRPELVGNQRTADALKAPAKKFQSSNPTKEWKVLLITGAQPSLRSLHLRPSQLASWVSHGALRSPHSAS